MKTFFTVFAGLLLLNISACNRTNDDIRGSGDDVTIERQEDYDSDDARDSRDLPLNTSDEMEIDEVDD